MRPPAPAARVHSLCIIISAGTVRRKKKVVSKASKQEDKKILAAVKKYGPQPLDGIAEANMFKDDNSVIHFTKPSGTDRHVLSRV